MQRIVRLIVGLAPATLAAQSGAGTELWRLAATTLAVPPALASGGTAAFWNPASPASGGRGDVALEAIETASAVGATGMLGAARLQLAIGDLGLVYGRMSIGDLVRTSLSPDPDPGTIPYYTQSIGVNWSAAKWGTTIGATLGLQDTRLDLDQSDRVTFDVGARRSLTSAVTLAAATHFFSRFAASDPSQDLFGGIEWRVWRGPLWTGGGQGTVRARYGVSLAHGYSADHQFGAGFELGEVLALDLVLTREAGYAGADWRGVAGVRLAIGRYHLSFARDAGVNDVGAAYRVGLEARFP